MFEKLACLLTRWHTKLKNWHAVWHVATFIGMLAHENEKLASFWHISVQARWHVNRISTQPHCHVNHAGTQAHWHVGTLGTRFSELK